MHPAPHKACVNAGAGRIQTKLIQHLGAAGAAPATDSRCHAVPAAAPAARGARSSFDPSHSSAIVRSRLPQTRLLLAALLLLAGGHPAGAQGATGGARLLRAGSGRRADAIEIDGPPARRGRRRRLLPAAAVCHCCCRTHCAAPPLKTPQVPACRHAAGQRPLATAAAGHGELRRELGGQLLLRCRALGSPHPWSPAAPAPPQPWATIAP